MPGPVWKLEKLDQACLRAHCPSGASCVTRKGGEQVECRHLAKGRRARVSAPAGSGVRSGQEGPLSGGGLCLACSPVGGVGTGSGGWSEGHWRVWVVSWSPVCRHFWGRSPVFPMCPQALPT